MSEPSGAASPRSKSDVPLQASLLRVRLIAGNVSILALVATVALGLAAIFAHQGMLGTAALAALTTSTFANGVIEAWRGYALWRLGVWSGLAGQRFTRQQQPVRFRVWIAMHLLIASILLGGSGYLAWIVLQRL